MLSRGRWARGASVVLLCSVVAPDAGFAQAAAPSSVGQELPAVTVTAPQQQKQRQIRTESRGAGTRATRRSAQRTPPAPRSEVAASTRPETAFGPVTGYVASRSAGGTKTDTPLIQTPQSISVVAKDQIDAQQPRTVSSALNYTAGLYAEPRGSVNGLFEFPNIRGFSLPSFLYQDGMQLLGASAGLQVDPYGLERIEVIKGPASVLYGQGSPSGIVNLVTKRPTETPFNEIMLQGGSFSRGQLSWDAGGPIDPKGEFLYRFTGLGRLSDTQVDFTKDDRVYIAPSLTWRPTTNTTWTVLYNYQKANSGFFNFLPAAGTFLPNPNGQISTSFYAGDPNFNRSVITNNSVTSLFEHSFNNIVTFRSNYRHTELSVDQQVLTTGLLAANQRTLGRNTFVNKDAFTGDTIDNQLQFKFNTADIQHTVLTGIDYARSYEDHRTDAGLASSIDLFNPVYNQTFPPTIVTTLNSTQLTQQTGIYGQHQAQWGGWNTQIGVRHDEVSSDSFSRLTNRSTDTDDQAWTKRAGVLYLFDFGLAPYVSYSESFAPTSGFDRQTNPFKPTTGRQYEAGLKYQPKGYSAFFTFAAFDLVRQNVTTPDPVAPTTNLVQTGEVTSRGFEVEGKVSLTKSLDVVASYTYLDTAVTKSNNVAELGRIPIGVPRNIASLWADYTFRGGRLSGFGVAGGARYVGSTYADTNNTTAVPDYTLFDAAIHYELGEFDPRLKGMKLAVNATNVFDHRYVASCLAVSSCFYGLRRNVIGTLSYRW